MTYNRDPAYQRITNDLREQIRSGVLRPGARVPSERQLCDAYGVSRIVPALAMRILVTEGYVVRVQGKGTYVARPGDVGRVPHCPTCRCAGVT